MKKVSNQIIWTGNYLCQGTAFITDWNNNDYFIEMKPFKIENCQNICHSELKEIVTSLLNDNGFGCQYIKGGVVKVKAEYQYNNQLFYIDIKTMVVDKSPYFIKQEELDYFFN